MRTDVNTGSPIRKTAYPRISGYEIRIGRQYDSRVPIDKPRMIVSFVYFSNYFVQTLVCVCIRRTRHTGHTISPRM